MEAKELKAKTPQELTQKVKELKAELFTLRFQNSTGQLDHPHKIKVIKRDIAKVFTVLAQQKKAQAFKKAISKNKKTSSKTKQTSTKTKAIKHEDIKHKEEAL